MAKVTHINKARERKEKQALVRKDGFEPCSPDMTICGDCQDNRTKNKCPRLKEWQEKRKD